MSVYDSPDSCNKCGQLNHITETEQIDAHMCECKTKCTVCGFEDYWAYGYFESGAEIESKCDKYSFEEDL